MAERAKTLPAVLTATALLAACSADPAAEAKVMCEKLLANTVIESYRIEVA